MSSLSKLDSALKYDVGIIKEGCVVYNDECIDTIYGAILHYCFTSVRIRMNMVNIDSDYPRVVSCTISPIIPRGGKESRLDIPKHKIYSYGEGTVGGLRTIDDMNGDLSHPSSFNEGVYSIIIEVNRSVVKKYKEAGIPDKILQAYVNHDLDTLNSFLHTAPVKSYDYDFYILDSSPKKDMKIHKHVIGNDFLI